MGNYDTLLVHSREPRWEKIAADEGLRLWVSKHVSPGYVFKLDSATIVTQDLRTGEVRRPFAI